MSTTRRPVRAILRASAVAVTAVVLVTAAGTPVAGGQDSGSIGSNSVDPGSGSGGGSLGSSDDPEPAGIELVDPDATPLWPNGRPVPHRIVPSADTTVADPGTVMGVTGATGEDQTTVLAPDQDDLPAVGEPFVVDVAPGSPTGVIGRVTGVTTLPSGLLQVFTEPIGIEDAYDEFSINTTVSLEDAVSTVGGAGAGPTGRMQSRSGASLPYRALPSLLECDAASPVDLDFAVTLAEMTAQVVFNPKDEYLKIVMRYTQSASFSMGVNAAIECELPERNMPAAFLPIAGPLGLKTGPVLEMEMGARASLTATTSATRADGVEISGGRTRAISRSENTHNELTGDGDVDASIFFGLKARLSADIGLSEASAGVSVGPELSVALNNRDCLELSASVRLAASVSASLMWVFEWSVDVVLARVGFLSLLVECGSTSTTTTRTTGTSTTTPTTTTTPPPGFRDGAITNLVVGAGLNCDVQSPTDGRSVYFGPGACATIAYVDGRSFGPSVPASGSFGEVWTPLSQTITGSATASDPMVIRTTVRAGATGIEIDQVDYFVDGNPGYQTDITVRNTSGVAKDVKVYRAMDCYLGRSDYGTGSVYSRSVSCNDASGRRIALTDLSGGALRQESHFSTIWDVARSGGSYSDTFETGQHDNGMGINWSRSIPASGSVALRSRFQLDEPANQVASAPAARVAPLAAGPDAKGGDPAERVRELPTSVPVN